MDQEIKKREPKDLIEAIAMDIGKEVAHHIETMYPEAVEAASSTFLLSVRNYTRNEIVNLLRKQNDMSVTDWLLRRGVHRKYIKSVRKGARKQ